MPKTFRKTDLHEHVKAILEETGVDDPFEAVRIKARAVVDLYSQAFGESPPFNAKALASLRGLHWSEDDPKFSEDSEIAPESDRVVLRVNSARPLTRQRFSICHEVGHTLFPEYQMAVRCRKGNESFANEDDLLETLCDVAASELMFPAPWFENQIKGSSPTAEFLANLAESFQASREATIRRFIESFDEPVAAVFYSWKLKPKEKRKLKAQSQIKPLFPDLEDERPQEMLRVDYRVANDEFDRVCNFIPADKSIPCEGPIFEASQTQRLQDGVQQLDFGNWEGKFDIAALPIYTVSQDLGPEGGCSVVAVLRPV